MTSSYLAADEIARRMPGALGHLPCSSLDLERERRLAYSAAGTRLDDMIVHDAEALRRERLRRWLQVGAAVPCALVAAVQGAAAAGVMLITVTGDGRVAALSLPDLAACTAARGLALTGYTPDDEAAETARRKAAREEAARKAKEAEAARVAQWAADHPPRQPNTDAERAEVAKCQAGKVFNEWPTNYDSVVGVTKAASGDGSVSHVTKECVVQDERGHLWLTGSSSIAVPFTIGSFQTTIAGETVWRSPSEVRYATCLPPDADAVVAPGTVGRESGR